MTDYKINLGGSQIGEWLADTPYHVSGGNVAPQSIVSNPTDAPDGVFNTEYWDEAYWKFPITSGDYIITIYVMETFSGFFAPNQRVFQVSVNGVVPTGFSAIDPYALAGAGNTGASVSVLVENIPAGDLDIRTIDFDSSVYALKIEEVVANQLPTPFFTVTRNDLEATFDASTSSDPDGSITDYTWDFGDGNTGIGVNPVHTYAASGTYSVKLTVTDNDGDSASITTPVPVQAGIVTDDSLLTKRLDTSRLLQGRAINLARNRVVSHLLPDRCTITPAIDVATRVVNRYGVTSSGVPANRTWNDSEIIPCRADEQRSFRPDELDYQPSQVDELDLHLPYNVTIQETDIVTLNNNRYSIRKLIDDSAYGVTKIAKIMRVTTEGVK